MSDDRERDLQDWFNGSVQVLPRESFTLGVVEKVKRTERLRQLRGYASLLVAFLTLCSLLPQLITPLNLLAALPVKVIVASGEQWPWLVVLGGGLAYWLVSRFRHRGFLRSD